MDELQTLIAYNHLHDATFATGLLEAAGIYYIVDDVSGAVFSQPNRVRIKVFSRDMSRAADVLKTNGLEPLEPNSKSDLHAPSAEISDEEFENRFKYSAFADPEPDRLGYTEMEPQQTPIRAREKKTFLEENKFVRWIVLFLLIQLVFFILKHI